MQLVFGVGQRSVGLATLETIVLAIEIAFLCIISPKIITASGVYRHFEIPRCRRVLNVQQ
jgi:hypothetical protein